MTDKELLALVTRYTEACDDLGCDLFVQGAEKHKELHDKATELWTQIQTEVQRLHDGVNALGLAVQAMRAPLDDWKGELERKALDAARAVLGAA